jgi:hypothetical protein
VLQVESVSVYDVAAVHPDAERGRLKRLGPRSNRARGDRRVSVVELLDRAGIAAERDLVIGRLAVREELGSRQAAGRDQRQQGDAQGERRPRTRCPAGPATPVGAPAAPETSCQVETPFVTSVSASVVAAIEPARRGGVRLTIKDAESILTICSICYASRPPRGKLAQGVASRWKAVPGDARRGLQ